jgi:gas vesicle protein
MSKKNNNNLLFIGGMIIGSTIGVLTGLLVAPRSGKETRKIVQKTAKALPEIAEDFSSTVQLNTNRLSSSARKNWGQTLTRLQKAIASGIEASQVEVSRTQNRESKAEHNPKK